MWNVELSTGISTCSPFVFDLGEWLNIVVSIFVTLTCLTFLYAGIFGIRINYWIEFRQLLCLNWPRPVGLTPTVVTQNDNTLQWRHNGRDSVSNHQPHDCLLSRLFRCRSKNTSTLRVTGLCAGNSPGTGEFPAQMASYAENVSNWWRHHDYKSA